MFRLNMLNKQKFTSRFIFPAIRLHSTRPFNAFAMPQFARNSTQTANKALSALGILSVVSLYTVNKKPILNETFDIPHKVMNIQDPTKPRYDGAFNGKVSYDQIALGSVSGLVLGYALSRLSTVIFFLTLVFYLAGIYLKSRGITIVEPKKLTLSTATSVDWEGLIFGQPSFSIPFIQSFLIAATL